MPGGSTKDMLLMTNYISNNIKDRMHQFKQESGFTHCTYFGGNARK